MERPFNFLHKMNPSLSRRQSSHGILPLLPFFNGLSDIFELQELNRRRLLSYLTPNDPEYKFVSVSRKMLSVDNLECCALSNETLDDTMESSENMVPANSEIIDGLYPTTSVISESDSEETACSSMLEFTTENFKEISNQSLSTTDEVEITIGELEISKERKDVNNKRTDSSHLKKKQYNSLMHDKNGSQIFYELGKSKSESVVADALSGSPQSSSLNCTPDQTDASSGKSNIYSSANKPVTDTNISNADVVNTNLSSGMDELNAIPICKIVNVFGGYHAVEPNIEAAFTSSELDKLLNEVEISKPHSSKLSANLPQVSSGSQHEAECLKKEEQICFFKHSAILKKKALKLEENVEKMDLVQQAVCKIRPKFKSRKILLGNQLGSTHVRSRGSAIRLPGYFGARVVSTVQKKAIGVVVYPGCGKPLHPLVEQHVGKLREKKTCVDALWANFASMALSTNDSNDVRSRMVIPAYHYFKVTPDEKLLAEFKKSSFYNNFTFSSSREVATDVQEVLDYMITLIVDKETPKPPASECNVPLMRLNIRGVAPWCMNHSCYSCSRCGLSGEETYKTYVPSVNESLQRRYIRMPPPSLPKSIKNRMAGRPKRGTVSELVNSFLYSDDCIRAYVPNLRERFISEDIEIYCNGERTFIVPSNIPPLSHSTNIRNSSRIAPKIRHFFFQHFNAIAILYDWGPYYEMCLTIDSDKQQAKNSLRRKISQTINFANGLNGFKWLLLSLAHVLGSIVINCGNYEWKVPVSSINNEVGFIRCPVPHEHHWLFGIFILREKNSLVAIGPYAESSSNSVSITLTPALYPKNVTITPHKSEPQGTLGSLIEQSMNHVLAGGYFITEMWLHAVGPEVMELELVYEVDPAAQRSCSEYLISNAPFLGYFKIYREGCVRWMLDSRGRRVQITSTNFLTRFVEKWVTFSKDSGLKWTAYPSTVHLVNIKPFNSFALNDSLMLEFQKLNAILGCSQRSVVVGTIMLRAINRIKALEIEHLLQMKALKKLQAMKIAKVKRARSLAAELFHEDQGTKPWGLKRKRLCCFARDHSYSAPDFRHGTSKNMTKSSNELQLPRRCNTSLEQLVPKTDGCQYITSPSTIELIKVEHMYASPEKEEVASRSILKRKYEDIPVMPQNSLSNTEQNLNFVVDLASAEDSKFSNSDVSVTNSMTNSNNASSSNVSVLVPKKRRIKITPRRLDLQKVHANGSL